MSFPGRARKPHGVQAANVRDAFLAVVVGYAQSCKGGARLHHGKVRGEGLAFAQFSPAIITLSGFLFPFLEAANAPVHLLW